MTQAQRPPFSSPRLAAPALVAMLLASFALGGPARADPAEMARAPDGALLTLSAEGASEAAPDMATITLGVAAQAPTAGEAMRLDAGRMGQVLAALKKTGLAERDIQTSSLSLAAQYDYAQNQPARLTGYQAANEVTVTISDLQRLGPAVDAAVAAGADQVRGISFGLKDPRAAEDVARRTAVANLQAKAALYANATGLRLAGLVSLTEGGGYAPRPGPVMGLMRAAAAPTPVAPGEMSVKVEITGVYRLAP